MEKTEKQAYFQARYSAVEDRVERYTTGMLSIGETILVIVLPLCLFVLLVSWPLAVFARQTFAAIGFVVAIGGVALTLLMVVLLAVIILPGSHLVLMVFRVLLWCFLHLRPHREPEQVVLKQCRDFEY